MNRETDRRKINRRARKQEERAGDRQPASGAKWWAKGDAIRGELLVSCKTTTKKQIPLTVMDLLETQVQARQQGKIPVWFIELDAARPLQIPAEYVLMRKEDFDA